MSQVENFIEDIRQKAAPFIEDSVGAVLPQIVSAGLADNSPAGRFIRKIPKQNYEDLPRLVPINWL